ncbi:hypothetical protein IFM89_006404 [Coptis chinensis]|uniref:Uncharacterized protein n=1 Tax=Coptis chinensis TaxID=261450 RepID=A0A835HRB7_9MAGN|nr:hypothetical protein IFM89_006404 [Coptis chinensis]
MGPSIHVDCTVVEQIISKYSKKQSDAMMGKTQRFSKGYSSGFVSDYRVSDYRNQSIDNNNNLAESEGLGSSGRADTASEDSSGPPKRKCISLNVDSCDGFGIPVQVFRVSKMSRSERRKLEVRLRSELDQVQSLEKKIIGQFSNVVAVSSSPGKKKGPFGRNSHNLKQGISGKFKSVKEVIPTTTTSDSKFMEQCEALLSRLMAHDYGWVFNVPVDVVKLNIPDYFTVIKHPMDLGTVKSKISSGQYSSPWGFLSDVRLAFSNAMTYNPPTNDVHIMAKTLSKFFEVRWKNIQKKLPTIESVQVPAKSTVTRESKAPIASSPSKKRKHLLIDHQVKTEPVKTERIMTERDKVNLSRDLESLLAELPNHIIDFLREHSFSEGQTDGEDEMEVDIDVLSDDTLFTLRKLVDNYLQEKLSNRAKNEPGEVEVLNVSGISNSLMQPCKGNDPVDEDVDIGGNDPPISSYPPVEIEKDTARGSSKCSSSNSSSSDSSSSSEFPSADSDSGNSSSSGTDGAKASSPVNETKETLDSVADEQTNNHGSSHDGNQSLSGLDQLEQNPEHKPISIEADSRQEEENAQPERQVSPEKLYRAALLRDRFADTILKARQKTLDQGEKGDPEKLRREREELERKQREEKARLQAEAKAAENARRQADAEAAVEAKRKRELEREAARQALQNMEKTVEINENCQFLEDLEMLGSAPVPCLPLAIVISPDHSDGIGGFKLQGSNPLEQLGLYMKMDDEEAEEEEGVSTSVPDPMNDVEEGEID